MIEQKHKGIVYLAGAGPGDPKLITLKALNCIHEADVIIYDHLVNDKLLQEASPGCQLIYVGKKPGRHTLPQAEINQLLIAKARQNKVVVRLKGGDPFVFGRGGEEALELAARGIPFVIIPGISAGMAAAAYAGIPLSQRGISTAINLITGHEAAGKSESSIDWNKLGRPFQTLVFYMGVKNLPQISAKLMENGLPSDTPVAVIQDGTTTRQKTVSSTLSNIVTQCRKEQIQPPAVIIIGQVVNLHRQLNWFEKLPLWGQTIISTRQADHSLLDQTFSRQGASIIEFPVIQTRERENKRPLEQAINSLAQYDWLIFTSRTGVRIFLKNLLNLGSDVRKLAHLKIAAIGSATADELKKYGLAADLVPAQFIGESLARSLTAQEDLAGRKILLPRSALGRKQLCRDLCQAGASVDDIPIYDTLQPQYSQQELDRIRDRIRSSRLTWITFTSSSTVHHFMNLIQNDFIRSNRSRLKLISIGPITSAALQEAGFKADGQADPYHIPALISKMEQLMKTGKEQV